MLGDYVDRGPDSKEVVDRLIRLHETLHIVSLAGNHEEMVLEWRNNHHMNCTGPGFTYHKNRTGQVRK